MKRRIIVLIVTVLAAASLLSCREDVVVSCIKCGAAVLPGDITWGYIKQGFLPYGNLTGKDDVLENLQRAYNERNVLQVDKRLDDEFLFFFSEEDFSSGRTPRLQLGTFRARVLGPG